MSEYSHKSPELKLSLGQAPPPSVVAFWQTAVVALHGPSPTLPRAFDPPTHVWAVCGSSNVWPSA